MVISECQWFGVAIEIASRSLSSSALRMSCTHFGALPPLSRIFRLARFEQAAVGVDQVRDLHVLEAEVLVDVGVPLPVDAGHADADRVVGPEHPAGRLGAGDREQRKTEPAAAAVLRNPRRETLFMMILAAK